MEDLFSQFTFLSDQALQSKTFDPSTIQDLMKLFELDSYKAWAAMELDCDNELQKAEDSIEEAEDYLDSCLENAMEEFQRFEDELDREVRDELRGLDRVAESVWEMGKSMEKDATAASNKYVEDAVRSAGGPVKSGSKGNSSSSSNKVESCRVILTFCLGYLLHARWSCGGVEVALELSSSHISSSLLFCVGAVGELNADGMSTAVYSFEIARGFALFFWRVSLWFRCFFSAAKDQTRLLLFQKVESLGKLVNGLLTWLMELSKTTSNLKVSVLLIFYSSICLEMVIVIANNLLFSLNLERVPRCWYLKQISPSGLAQRDKMGLTMKNAELTVLLEVKQQQAELRGGATKLLLELDVFDCAFVAVLPALELQVIVFNNENAERVYEWISFEEQEQEGYRIPQANFNFDTLSAELFFLFLVGLSLRRGLCWKQLGLHCNSLDLQYADYIMVAVSSAFELQVVVIGTGENQESPPPPLSPQRRHPHRLPPLLHRRHLPPCPPHQSLPRRLCPPISPCLLRPPHQARPRLHPLLRLLQVSNISLLLTIPNSLLPYLAQNRHNADRYLHTHVVPFYPHSRISAISVGTDALNHPIHVSNDIFPAIQNIYLSLQDLGITDIAVSTTFTSTVLTESFPPSSAEFQAHFADLIINQLLDFLHRTNSSFFININPYDVYKADPRIPIGFALFQQSPFNYRDDKVTGVRYRNLFDQTVDAFISAMAVAGHENIPVVVTETGWPSSPRAGDTTDPDATELNAEQYVNGLIGHLKSGLGTPLRKEGVAQTYIYELFDTEYQMDTFIPLQPYYGILYPNMTRKVYVDF
ncbi:hypothetical protein Vadar_011867 [Vaccinium darrowii]|uniref:Uncharacterized protein n=1 Tax=Vaccinium darrowii TaxID=229202 RepID=A0ACB7ZL37_9ERIC|nr:hypothetical protein Vadar_011867 [Vaccinium darrowii]